MRTLLWGGGGRKLPRREKRGEVCDGMCDIGYRIEDMA